MYRHRSHLLWIATSTSILLSTLQPIARSTQSKSLGAPPVVLSTLAGTSRPVNRLVATTTIARLDLTSPLPTTSRRNSRQLVKIGALTTYRHPSNLFSIAIPQQWQLEDLSEPNHVRVQWQDSNRHGLVCVEIFNYSDRLTATQLGTELSQVLEKVYGEYPQLSIGRPIAQANGTIRVDWSYQKETSNGAIVSYTGNSYIQQIGDKISASYYVLPSQQSTQLAAPLKRIIKSYQVSEDIDIP
jgi:hypothetical protein